MLQPWRTGKIIRIQQETSFTRRFWIQVPELEHFDFLPGQFVTLDLPIHDKPNKRWRSYSIASWPNGTNVFELIIVQMNAGPGTAYLFNELGEGSEVSFRGAQGVFTLPAAIDTDLFLICTGTGIAPFRSMVQHIKQQHIPHRDVYLIFGTRTKGDLLYYDELKDLEKHLPGFTYVPVLSREQWEGHTGYVHGVYEAICQQKQQTNYEGELINAPASFYLCGWKDMIMESRQRITALGYERKNIHQELYG